MKKIILSIVLCAAAVVVAVAVNQYYETKKVACGYCGGYGQIATMYGPVVCANCGGTGAVYVQVPVPYNPNFGGDSKRLVTTNAECEDCSCPGYKGYKHSNGTYEGACQRKLWHGKTCGHSPSDHGLREW